MVSERDPGPRKVLMSPDLMEQWATRDAFGARLSWDWGNADADGFYTPTLTRHEDDNLVTAALAALLGKVKELDYFDPEDRIVAMNGTVREPRTMADSVDAYRTRLLALIDAEGSPGWAASQPAPLREALRLAERHVPYDTGFTSGRPPDLACRHCCRRWPCDVELIRAALVTGVREPARESGTRGPRYGGFMPFGNERTPGEPAPETRE